MLLLIRRILIQEVFMQNKRQVITKAFKCAFPHTIPIFAGFCFLGMTRGTSIAVLNSKSRGVLIVKVRGTRFALGRNITKNILVG